MMRRSLLTLHRYASLALAAVWAFQALTGLTLVFHRDMENLLVGGAPAKLEAASFSRGLEALAQRTGKPIFSVVAADRDDGRFDVFTDDGDLRIARIDGRGALLAERGTSAGLGAPDLFDRVLSLHQTLWLGASGRWLIGASGALLASNLILGLSLAWPAAGRWLAALRPRDGLPWPARLYAWHRALGLALGGLALILVLAGAAMALGDPFKAALGANRRPPQITETAQTAPRLSAATAIDIAQARYPGARLSVLVMPSARKPYFTARLRQGGELERFFGGTALYIDARDGRILKDYDGLRAPPARALFDNLYALHTIEFLGVAGRILAFLLASWLLTMIALGLSLWRARRKRKPAL